MFEVADRLLQFVCMFAGADRLLQSVCMFAGADRFSQDMKMMFGWGAPVILRFSWCVTSPLLFFIFSVMMFSGYQDITYEGYRYPKYAITMGYMLALVPVVPLPICAVYEFVKRKGSIKQVCLEIHSLK